MGSFHSKFGNSHSGNDGSLVTTPRVTRPKGSVRFRSFDRTPLRLRDRPSLSFFQGQGKGSTWTRDPVGPQVPRPRYCSENPNLISLSNFFVSLCRRRRYSGHGGLCSYPDSPFFRFLFGFRFPELVSLVLPSPGWSPVSFHLPGDHSQCIVSVPSRRPQLLIAHGRRTGTPVSSAIRSQVPPSLFR